MCHTIWQAAVCVWTSSADGKVIPTVYPTLVIEGCARTWPKPKYTGPE